MEAQVCSTAAQNNVTTMTSADDEPVDLILLNSSGQKTQVRDKKEKSSRSIHWQTNEFLKLCLSYPTESTLFLTFPRPFYYLFVLQQLVVSLRQPLSALKAEIEECDALGNIPTSNQRIFFLGREIKTNGRSLETLGVGRFNIMVLHVHNTRPGSKSKKKHKSSSSCSRSSKSKHQSSSISPKPGRRKQAPGRQVEIVDLADDDDDDEVCILETVPASTSKRRRQV